MKGAGGEEGWVRSAAGDRRVNVDRSPAAAAPDCYGEAAAAVAGGAGRGGGFAAGEAGSEVSQVEEEKRVCFGRRPSWV
jgi:hypothetical protein